MKSNDIKRQSGLVRIRGGFSDVQGIAPCNTMIQTTEFDDDTRMTLSNRISALLEYYFEGPGAYDQFGGYKGGNYQESFCKAILNEVLQNLLVVQMKSQTEVLLIVSAEYSPTFLLMKSKT